MKYVTSRYVGRLGNNMFQLAAAIGYARRYGYEWASLDKNIEVPEWFDYFPHLPRGPILQRTYSTLAPCDYDFKPIPNMGVVYLQGFFQSKKFFENCEDEIKNVFSIPDLGDEFKKYCSIHVRRGDYVTHASDFPPVTIRYIHTAIKEMKERGHKRFMIFSDDLNWCKKMLPGIGLSEGRNPFEDMTVMANCSNHIIANSSFSWWAAYLGKNHNRHIIAPSHKTWFGKKNGVVQALGTPKDIIPKEWQQIDL